MSSLASLALTFALAAPGAQPPEEPPDTRELWAYEGGWFAREAKGGAWYEMNEEAHRLGKSWKFQETSRTRQYVELYDRDRKVTVRLTPKAAQVRWDKDGRDAPWTELYKGRWKKRE